MTRLLKVTDVEHFEDSFDFHFEITEFLKGDGPSGLVLRVDTGTNRRPRTLFNYLLFLRNGQTKVGVCEPAIFPLGHTVFAWYNDFRISNEK